MKVYAVKTTGEEYPSQDILDKLDTDRKAKIEKIARLEDKKRSIYAGLLLRYAFLQEGYSKTDWKEIQIGKGEHGKPYAVGFDDFHYSLSHSGEWVVCAVSTQPVGVDIQEKKPWKEAIAKRFFAAEEYERLQAIEQENEKEKVFYQMWSAKESYGKLLGTGIGQGMDYMLTDEHCSQIENQRTCHKARIKTYDFAQNYCLCVCIEQGEFSQQVSIVSQMLLTGDNGGEVC